MEPRWKSETYIHQAADNTQLVTWANEALHNTGSPPQHRFVGTRRLNNGSLLMEMDSREAAAWLSSPANKATFLGQFALDATLKSQTYLLVIVMSRNPHTTSLTLP